MNRAAWVSHLDGMVAISEGRAAITGIREVAMWDPETSIARGLTRAHRSTESPIALAEFRHTGDVPTSSVAAVPPPPHGLFQNVLFHFQVVSSVFSLPYTNQLLSPCALQIIGFTPVIVCPPSLILLFHFFSSSNPRHQSGRALNFVPSSSAADSSPPKSLRLSSQNLCSRKRTSIMKVWPNFRRKMNNCVSHPI